MALLRYLVKCGFYNLKCLSNRYCPRLSAILTIKLYECATQNAFQPALHWLFRQLCLLIFLLVSERHEIDKIINTNNLTEAMRQTQLLIARNTFSTYTLGLCLLILFEYVRNDCGSSFKFGAISSIKYTINNAPHQPYWKFTHDFVPDT